MNNEYHVSEYYYYYAAFNAPCHNVSVIRMTYTCTVAEISKQTKSGELLSQYHLNDIPNIAINVENAPELSFLKISSFNVAGYPYTTVRRYRFSWKQLV